MTDHHLRLFLPLPLLLLAAISLAGCASTARDGIALTDLPEGMRTPYTAEQIREANPAGTELKFRVERAGELPAIQTIRFVSTDDRTAVVQQATHGMDGSPVGDPQRQRSTWLELHDHALFPPEQTTRSDEMHDGPMGRDECWKYTVREDDEETVVVSRFWFARGRPGPPVRYEIETGGERAFVMVMIEDER